MNILLAYSGGLDTSYLTAKLSAEGHAVTAVTVDCGGFSHSEKKAVAARALALGAASHRFVSAKDTLFERVLTHLIAGNVRRGGTYPLCVAAERSIQAELLAQLAVSDGFDALAHGCTAAGNDQVRFEAALWTCAPELTVLAPVRDEAPSRADQRAYLEAGGHALPPAGGEYSINAGLWGLTIGGGVLLDTLEPLPEEAWLWTVPAAPASPAAPAAPASPAPIGPTTISVSFKGGLPTAVDGVAMEPVELIEYLNALAGASGIGRGYHTGDTVLGIKGRIAFEAPAAEVLLTAHGELEKLVLTGDQRFWKDHLAELYGRRLHAGLFHDPLMRNLEALFTSTQERVSGTVMLQVHGAGLLVTGIDTPHSMLAASDARYGERPAAAADPRAAVGLARTMAEPARLFAAAAAPAPEPTNVLSFPAPAPTQVATGVEPQKQNAAVSQIATASPVIEAAMTGSCG
ncbi:MAG: argininosuccinate synthase [Planctomycetota bacterium]|jgi:argininosuccinate synthase|nr:argininosuccinate synthase [Planctomycetota bacterium]